LKKALIAPMLLWSSAITFLLVLFYATLVMWYSSNIRLVFFAQWFFPVESGAIWLWITLIAALKHFILLLVMKRRKTITRDWMITLVLIPWLLFIPVFWSLFFLFGPPTL
jgi:hypothetical protein